MTDEIALRAALRDRLIRVAQEGGLPAPADAERLTDVVSASGASIHFHHILTDQDMLAKLEQARGRDPSMFTDAAAINPTGVRHSPAFAAFLVKELGSREWSKLAPTAKIDLLRKFNAIPAPSAADRLAESLLVRHGSAENVLAKASATERLALHHALADAPKPPKPIVSTVTPAQLAALNAIRQPGERLAIHAAMREFAALAGSTRAFDQDSTPSAFGTLWQGAGSMIDPITIATIRNATLERIAGKITRRTFGMLYEPIARRLLSACDEADGIVAASVVVGLCDVLALLAELGAVAPPETAARLDGLAVEVASMVHAGVVAASQPSKPRSRRKCQA